MRKFFAVILLLSLIFSTCNTNKVPANHKIWPQLEMMASERITPVNNEPEYMPAIKMSYGIRSVEAEIIITGACRTKARKS